MGVGSHPTPDFPKPSRPSMKPGLKDMEPVTLFVDELIRWQRHGDDDDDDDNDDDDVEEEKEQDEDEDGDEDEDADEE